MKSKIDLILAAHRYMAECGNGDHLELACRQILNTAEDADPRTVQDLKGDLGARGMLHLENRHKNETERAKQIVAGIELVESGDAAYGQDSVWLVSARVQSQPIDESLAADILKELRDRPRSKSALCRELRETVRPTLGYNQVVRTLVSMEAKGLIDRRKRGYYEAYDATAEGLRWLRGVDLASNG